jgi:tetratricopeptide (TPR) repeat protein
MSPAMSESMAAPVSELSLVQEMDAICSSAAFRHSPQQQRFLRHIVAALRQGNVSALREMTLGIEVFRRPPGNFDPKKDPIVRVEARRLRDRLARYYVLEGEHAAVEIVVPIGSYIPLVRQRQPVEPAAAAQPSRVAALVQRGDYVMRLRTIEGYRKSLELFARALDEDHDCVAALLGIAWTRICIAGFDAVPPEAGEQREPMRAAIERARAIEPENSHVAILSGAYAFRYEYAFESAERWYRAGSQRAPSDPRVCGSLGWLYAMTGRFAEAQSTFEAALARDPFGFWHRHNLASLAYLRRDFGAAEIILRDALEIEPDHAIVRLLLARVLTCSGRGHEAIAETGWCKTALPGMTGAELFHIAALASAGNKMDAADAMREFERDSHGRYVSPVSRVMAYAALGDEDAAIRWLVRAAAERDYWLPNVVIDPAFDCLRGRPEFAAILRSVGMREAPGETADRV